VSLIWDAAIDEWKRVRGDYRLHLEAQYAAAVNATNNVLMNARGWDADVDSFSLFSGPMSRARAYASEELLDFWQHTSPRMTFAMFERQSYEWFEAL
jgi:hypothetical protein